ncbi:hypothetical protein STPH1_7782 [Streptomyces sp. OM5714]|nr:hypothetical protein STPH1_7782 [Streptomyces sp. OM5714]
MHASRLLPAVRATARTSRRTASPTRTSEASLTRSTRTSSPENNTSSTVLLATAGNTLRKRSTVPVADPGIHRTADRAGFKKHHHSFRAHPLCRSALPRSRTACLDENVSRSARSPVQVGQNGLAVRRSSPARSMPRSAARASRTATVASRPHPAGGEPEGRPGRHRGQRTRC